MKATLLALLAGAAAAVPAAFPTAPRSSLMRRGAALPPSQDPFYTPPSNSSGGMGKVLRSRQLPALYNSSTATYQFLYSTLGSVFNPETAVTTLFVPRNPDPNKLVSYQVAYDSVNIDSSPSYVFQQPGNMYMDNGVIQHALSQGWYVVSSDYEEADSAFTNGAAAGIAVLDSVRAVLSSGSQTGLSPNATIIYGGYDGGAFATDFALEFNEGYAPELEFGETIGGAIAGNIPNASATWTAVNKSPFAGYIPLMAVGWGTQISAWQQYLQGQLVPEKADAFNNVTKGGFIDALTQFAGQDIFSYFQAGEGILTSSEFTMTTQLYVNQAQHRTPGVGLYVWHAVKDEVTPIEAVDAYVAQYCEQGANIIYVRNSTSNHQSGDGDSWAGINAWMDTRFQTAATGVQQAEGCTTTTT